MYLNFNISIVNYGFKDVSNASLNVSVDNKTVKVFELGELQMGTRKLFSVENLKVLGDSDNVKFDVISSRGNI